VIAVSPERIAEAIIVRSRSEERPPFEGSDSPFNGVRFRIPGGGEGNLMRRAALGALVVTIGVLVSACGASVRGFHAEPGRGGVAGAHHVLTSVTVKTAKVKGLGTILVDSKGFVLYVFAPDKHKRVTCKGNCAAVWPPLKAHGKETAGGSAKASLLGADRTPSGGKVVTYAHWPLYTYVADTKPGQASGQDTNLNGGYWYVISPAGKVIKKP
jgi:predicted lipoprotein with Yx(FWY)xxD motif